MTVTTVDVVDVINQHVNELGENAILFIESKKTFSVTNGEFSMKHDGDYIEKKYLNVETIIPSDVLGRGADLTVTVEKTKDTLNVTLSESNFSIAFDYELTISLA